VSHWNKDLEGKKKGSNNHDGNIIKILMEHMLPDRVNHSEFSFLWVDETQSNFLYPPLTQILLLSLLESDACVWLLSCFSLSFISLPNSPAQFKSSDSKTSFLIFIFYILLENNLNYILKFYLIT
jgi:hypothetical protein